MRKCGSWLAAVIVVLAGFLLSSPEARAQDACRGIPGEVMVGLSPGSNGLAPVPLCTAPQQSPSQGQPRQPAISFDEALRNLREANIQLPECINGFFTHQWGAVYEAADGSVYESHCRANSKSASEAAELTCQRSQRGACRPVAAGKQKFIAISRHDGRNFVAIKGSDEAAIGQAEGMCRKAGGTQCGIWYLYNSRSGPLNPITRN